MTGNIVSRSSLLLPREGDKHARPLESDSPAFAMLALRSAIPIKIRMAFFLTRTNPEMYMGSQETLNRQRNLEKKRGRDHAS